MIKSVRLWFLSVFESFFAFVDLIVTKPTLPLLSDFIAPSPRTGF